MRSHLAEVGQPVLACQFAVLDFQFFRQASHLAAQCFVGLLQPQRCGVPGFEHSLQIDNFTEPAACVDERRIQHRLIRCGFPRHFVIGI